jgi:hypothetical protein
VLSPTTSFTQTKLPSDAGALLLAFLTPPCIGCFFYPFGKQQLIASENGRPAPVNDLNRGLLALERLGIIRIDRTDERRAKTATFDIALSAKPDEKNLVLERLGNKDGVCIKVYDYGAARVEFKKVEYVKGGRMGWTGAIAHAVLHGGSIAVIRFLRSDGSSATFQQRRSGRESDREIGIAGTGG